MVQSSRSICWIALVIPLVIRLLKSFVPCTKSASALVVIATPALASIFLVTIPVCYLTCLGLTPEVVKSNYRLGHVCWDDADVISGRPTGMIRLSLPIIALKSDIDRYSTSSSCRSLTSRLAECLKQYFCGSNYLKVSPNQNHSCMFHFSYRPHSLSGISLSNLHLPNQVMWRRPNQ